MQHQSTYRNRIRQQLSVKDKYDYQTEPWTRFTQHYVHAKLVLQNSVYKLFQQIITKDSMQILR